MKYSHLISDMTWSYSRLTAFEMCRYKFLLQYVKCSKGEPMFFSDYGSFVHSLMEQYLTGQLQKEELAARFLSDFPTQVHGKAPNQKIFKSYLEQGAAYLRDVDFPFHPELVEYKGSFELGGHPFVGITDCVARDKKGLIVVDHKSRALKPRSARPKPTQSDKELDQYLRQLYLYSIPVQQVFGELPHTLSFNCFRTHTVIREPFVKEKFEDAKVWAVNLIHQIEENEDWNPDIDFWKCSYLCEHHNNCEYYLTNFAPKRGKRFERQRNQ